MTDGLLGDILRPIEAADKYESTSPEKPSRRPAKVVGSGVANVRSLILELVGEMPHGWWRLISAALLSILATGSSVALMGVSAWLLSRAAELPPVLYLLTGATAVRTFGTGRGVFRYFERLRSHDVALRMQSALRLTVYDRLARTTLLGARRGDLLIRATADVEAIMDVVVRIALPFTSACVVLIGAVFILSFFNAASAIVLLVCSILAGIVMPWMSQRLSRRANIASIPARAELAQLVHAVARSSTDVVAYGRVEDELAAVAAVDAKLRRAEARAAWTRGLATGGQHVAMGLAVAAALYFGSQAVVAGVMPGRDLAVLALVPLALHETFGDLTKAAQTMTRASSALRRVVALLTAKPVGVGDRVVTGGEDHGTDGSEGSGFTSAGSGVDSRGPKERRVWGSPEAEGRDKMPQASRPAVTCATKAGSAESFPPLLTFENVTYRYGDSTVDALSPLNLSVGPGEIVALAGPSGAGKTTALELALGVLEPASGRVVVDGGPLTRDVAEDWRRHIAWAGQTPGLLGPTVAADVALGLPPGETADDAVLRDALDRVGGESIALDHSVGDDGEELSAGERRRVAMARALLRVERGGARLLLLDEPTAGLDEARETQILTTLRDLGVGVLVVSHREAVLSAADRVVEVAVPVMAEVVAR